MKTRIIKNARRWSIYGAVLTAALYAALTLTSQPAYAGSCTSLWCSSGAPMVCSNYCVHLGSTVKAVLCPSLAEPGEFECVCNNNDTQYFVCQG